MTKNSFEPSFALRVTFPDGSTKDKLFATPEAMELWIDDYQRAKCLFDEPQGTLEVWIFGYTARYSL